MSVTWRQLIEDERRSNKDESPIQDWAPKGQEEDVFNKPFDNGYGGPEGSPFVVWSRDYVYFPICYDGAEWCGSAPRNPPHEPLEHQGGG